MNKRKAIRKDHLGDMPLDLPGMFLRFERRYWDDGSSCLHIAKWGFQPKRGRAAPWMPQQYFQVPWELAKGFAKVLRTAIDKADPSYITITINPPEPSRLIIPVLLEK